MTMSLWACNFPGCDSRASGTGGAIGLRAIGWHFVNAGRLYCPNHRPDKVLCREIGANHGTPCGPCLAEEESDRLGAFISWTTETGTLDHPLLFLVHVMAPAGEENSALCGFGRSYDKVVTNDNNATVTVTCTACRMLRIMLQTKRLSPEKQE